MRVLRLSTNGKLFCASAILLTAIGLLSRLLIQQSFKDIDFAAKEREGIVYARTAWPLLSATNLADTVVQDQLAPLSAALAASAARLDGAMATAGESQDVQTAFAGSGPLQLARLRASTRALISKIGDGSNLILDPDLDSYYVMDALIVKLPELVEAARALHDQLTVVAQARAPDFDTKSQLMIALGRYESAMSGLSASIRTAIANSPDGSLERTLKPLQARLRTESDTFYDSVKQSASVLIDRADPSATRRAAPLHRSLQQSADQMWSATAAELDRLLEARITGFKSSLWSNLAIAYFVTLVALGLLAGIGLSITLGTRRLIDRMEALAKGDLSSTIPYGSDINELGKLSRAVGIFRDTLLEVARLHAETADANRATAEVRKATMLSVAASLEESILSATHRVRESAHEMAMNGQKVADEAQHSGQKVGEAIEASEVVAARAKIAEAESCNLAQAASEVRIQMIEATSISAHAEEHARSAEQTVAELTEAATHIGEVVQLIANIAAQTNLLALNATIEAARAGEAGRGFSVVAAEVKALAHQTASATSDIDQQVLSIQNATRHVVKDMTAIVSTIRKVGEIACAGAAAIDLQTAQIDSICHATAIASENAANFEHVVQTLKTFATTTLDLSRSSTSSCSEVGREAERLQGEVSNVLKALRQA